MSAETQRSGLARVGSQRAGAPQSKAQQLGARQLGAEQPRVNPRRYDCHHPAVRAAARRAGVDVHTYVELRAVGSAQA